MKRKISEREIPFAFFLAFLDLAALLVFLVPEIKSTTLKFKKNRFKKQKLKTMAKEKTGKEITLASFLASLDLVSVFLDFLVPVVQTITLKFLINSKEKIGKEKRKWK